MISVVFVCLGNICRSPMAEAVFLRLLKERGEESSFKVSSFGTSDCEEGNPVYPPVSKLLKERGYNFSHRAKMIAYQDIVNADYILVMDGSNLRDLRRLACGNFDDKIFLLGHFLPEERDIDDPWYTRDFERTYSEVYSSCVNFLNFLSARHKGALDYDKEH